MKVLFICNQNQNRSKTAEEVFRSHFTTLSAGLYNQRPVTTKQLEWADVVVVMEDTQRRELVQRFPQHCLQKRLLSLDIPDMYTYNDPRLISLLKLRMKKYTKNI